MNSPPEINWSLIKELEELGAGADGKSALQELFDMLFESVPIVLKDLQGAGDRHDAKKIASLAHGLKSSSGNLGLVAVAAIARDLENRGNAGDSEIAPQLKELELVCARSTQEIRNYLQKKG